MTIDKVKEVNEVLSCDFVCVQRKLMSTHSTVQRFVRKKNLPFYLLTSLTEEGAVISGTNSILNAICSVLFLSPALLHQLMRKASKCIYVSVCSGM